MSRETERPPVDYSRGATVIRDPWAKARAQRSSALRLTSRRKPLKEAPKASSICRRMACGSGAPVAPSACGVGAYAGARDFWAAGACWACGGRWLDMGGLPEATLTVGGP